MSKGSNRRPRLVSREELDFRWDYGTGRIPRMTEDAFKQKVKEIRKKSGKP